MRVRDPGALLDLIEGLYEVAAEPSSWPRWLGRLCDLLRTDAAILIRKFEPGAGDDGIVAVGLEGEESERRGPPTKTSFSSRPSQVATYLGYLAEDARLLSKAVALGPGELLVLCEVLPRTEFVATRLYREWLKPRGLHHLVSAVASRGPRHITGLSLLRRPRRPCFSPEDLDLLQRLLPHLQRVVQLEERLVCAERRHAAARLVLESARHGVVLLDQQGRVASANRRAGTLLARREGVELDRERLRAVDPRETAALESLIARAVASETRPSGGVLALSRSCRRHPLVVSVTPLDGREGRPPAAMAGALVLMSDPEDLPAVPEADLCRLYGLTQAESRVAAHVARGETVEEVAAALEIRPTTVKTHLQRVLAKTGTRRQLELARLLMSAAVAARSSEEEARLIRSEDAETPNGGL
jgi:DNA-binding CsgD family transcriptional regulator/PAS domain-containing protein